MFSEVMRDVDLFVGVASVGNNPTWQDGGPDHLHPDSWWGYSFGDLPASGDTRRDTLERLVPRLAIAPACSFEGKFLVVKRSTRTYKIHPGSGNILMEPGNQYLCIVPSSADQEIESVPGASGVRGKSKSRIFLPFEGDRVLSIILSKAMMLANDEAIKDKSIASQIGRR